MEVSNIYISGTLTNPIKGIESLPNPIHAVIPNSMNPIKGIERKLLIVVL